jgi:hypothetical protein
LPTRASRRNFGLTVSYYLLAVPVTGSLSNDGRGAQHGLCIESYPNLLELRIGRLEVNMEVLLG